MKSFSEMPFSAELQQRLADANFVTPTPIQAETIPQAIAGKDIMATAQTGTGKTLAFLIPIIEAQLRTKSSRNVETLILVPTRELAMQVHEQYEAVRGKSTLPAALVIGGMPEKRQIQSLRSGTTMIVATPGRLQDFLTRRLVDLSHITMLVLDEADRMLDMGFLPAIRRIVAVLPRQRQTLCFSATLEASVAGLVNEYMRNPVRVALGSTLKPAETVELQAFEVAAAEKADVLRHLLYSEKGQTLVFARTKRGAERIAKSLIRDGFTATMIHGDRTQSQRNNALAGFDSGEYQVLVATDLASRGIHVNEVAHVINYDLPNMAEDFIHRVGRTGRMGTRGMATTIVAGIEVTELRQIERALKLRIERKQVGQNSFVPPPRNRASELASRTLTALPGEIFT
ncbi:MAG TPA: DEAD/DEAH box helicase [Terriglobales bacterium]|nr:DEAD/DEAH box helicase [Terriglobales bacterium]